MITPLHKCHICDGTGFFVTNPEAYGGWYDCPECHGKGWLTDQEIENNRAKWMKGFGKVIEKHNKIKIEDYLTKTY